MTFSLFLKDFTLSDPLISADRLFHSRIVLGKKILENFFAYKGHNKRVISTQIVCISVMGYKIADLP